ncbi:hypothetical protein ACMHYB_39410 [Sorangium sp. So ce1128]
MPPGPRSVVLGGTHGDAGAGDAGAGDAGRGACPAHGSGFAARAGGLGVTKGGYWSKPWAGCRGTNDSHGPMFRFYEIGFRCCKDPRPVL